MASNRGDSGGRGPRPNNNSMANNSFRSQSQQQRNNRPVSNNNGMYSNNNSNNNNGLRRGKHNNRPMSSASSTSYQNTNRKWGRNDQIYDSTSGHSDRFGRNRQPRYERPLLPQTDLDNPFAFDISQYDLELSSRTFQEQYDLYSGLVVDSDVILKFQALAIVAQQNLYKQQLNYNEFMEEKRQNDIDRWLASISEEDRKKYLERTKLASSGRISTAATANATSIAASVAESVDHTTSSVSSTNILAIPDAETETAPTTASKETNTTDNINTHISRSDTASDTS